MSSPFVKTKQMVSGGGKTGGGVTKIFILPLFDLKSGQPRSLTSAFITNVSLPACTHLGDHLKLETDLATPCSVAGNRIKSFSIF